MKAVDQELLKNQADTPPDVFLASYNKSIPTGFPQASVKMMNEFRTAYPSLFKKGDVWSIERHRKKLMDWLQAYR
jgi:hypothetical protein